MHVSPGSWGERNGRCLSQWRPNRVVHRSAGPVRSVHLMARGVEPRSEPAAPGGRAELVDGGGLNGRLRPDPAFGTQLAARVAAITHRAAPTASVRGAPVPASASGRTMAIQSMG